MIEVAAPAPVFLVRYGQCPEVARFIATTENLPNRDAWVVVETDRGRQIGRVLERLKAQLDPQQANETEFKLIRTAIASDLESARDLQKDCEAQFPQWCARISQWGLQLELIDLEWTLDRKKLILYVLCERGPDSTKLALQAAASGFGIIEVQPVSENGMVTLPKSGCGSGGCGCEH